MTPTSLSQPQSPRVGLVLGAGGTAGLAFHVGTLLALQTDTGWDPATADVVVGTSAGSIVGALLRGGATTDDLAAWGSDVEPAPGRHGIRAVLESAADTRPRLHLPTPPRVRDVRRALHSVLTKNARLPAAAVSALPFGLIDASASLRRFAELGPGWPSDALSIVAVRAGSGRRAVFEHGTDEQGTEVDLGQAVAASCAIPFVYRPVDIEGRLYIDGAVHSPTNADLLIGKGIDTVVVLSPMSGPSQGRLRGPQGVGRRHFSSLLTRECNELVEHGIEVIVFEPDRNTVATMGINALDRDRAPGVLTSSFLGVSPESRDRLRATLSGRLTGVERASVA